MVSNKAMNLEKLETNDSENIVFIGGVLIERAHYYTKLAERGRTIRKAVPIEDGALTEGVRYTGRTTNLWTTLFQARSTISTLYSKKRTRNNA